MGHFAQPRIACSVGSIDGAQSVTATIEVGRFRGHRGQGPKMYVVIDAQRRTR